MKKSNLSFRALRAGSYLYRFFFGKKIHTGRHRNRILKTTAAVTVSLSMSAAGIAQCNTFKNTNAANPISALLDRTKPIAGFAFADIDADGDQDLYVSYSDTSYPPQPMMLSFFRNIGTKEHPVFQADTASGFGTQTAGRNNTFMQFVDIDGDGDLDCFISDYQYYYNNSSGIIFYKNTGTPTSPQFSAGYPSPLPFLFSGSVQPFNLVDIDGDGDYDLFASDTPFLYYGYGFYDARVYFNAGTKTNPVWSAPVRSSIDKDMYRTYYDWNKDGLLDFFGIPLYSYGVRYYKNIGPKENPQYVKDPSEAPDFNHIVPYRLIDLNNDGFPEAFDFRGHYGILPPLAVINDSLLRNGNTVLYSQSRAEAYTYRWELNGKTILGATKYYCVPKKPGIYTLYVTGQCGTGVSLNYKFTTFNVTPLLTDSRIVNDVGIIGVSAKAYPNPFANTVTLQLTGKRCIVKVFDLTGRVLLSQITSEASLQVGKSLVAGMYLVEVWEGRELVYKTTVVKQ